MLRSILIKLCLGLGLAIGCLALVRIDALTLYFFRTFDLYAGLAVIAIWALVSWHEPLASLPRRPPGPSAALLLAAALIAALWVGTHGVMLDYPLSRDEHMVVFDGATYGEGRIFSRLPEEWAGYANALAPAFLQQTPDMTLLVSDYLPGNAAMRAWMGKVIDPAFAGPLYVAIALLALIWTARRLLADSPQAIWVVIGSYVLSAQILATGMTIYAMSAHLAFNSVWLALFIKDRWWSHGLAMPLGVAAMGLHQFVFHPLFAGPFILLLVWQRRWSLFVLYGLIYAAGVLVWMSWSGVVLSAAGITPGANGSGGVVDFVRDRALPLVFDQRDPAYIFMPANLLRAVTWNAVFALPFMVAAWALVRGEDRPRDPFVIALFGSLLLPIFFMSVVLPYQGHGWGYRYIHPMLGALALLAGYGYRECARVDRRRADGAVIAMGLASAIVMIPAALWSANSFVAPHAQTAAMIAEQDTDFVVIDNRKWPEVVDEVRNLPDLSNRPLIFARAALTQAQLRDLCQRGSVSAIAPEPPSAAPDAGETAFVDACLR